MVPAECVAELEHQSVPEPPQVLFSLLQVKGGAVYCSALVCRRLCNLPVNGCSLRHVQLFVSVTSFVNSSTLCGIHFTHSVFYSYFYLLFFLCDVTKSADRLPRLVTTPPPPSPGVGSHWVFLSFQTRETSTGASV